MKGADAQAIAGGIAVEYTGAAIGIRPGVVVRCSFCAKTQREVHKLIAGPDVFICDECISLCVDIIDEDARIALGLDFAIPGFGS